MEWIVKIDDRKKQRVLIKYEPQNSKIYFVGQHRVNNVWIDFSNNIIEFSHNLKNSDNFMLDIDTVSKTIKNVTDQLKTSVEIYDKINNTFSQIKNIDVEKNNEELI